MSMERTVTPTLRMLKGETPGRLYELDREATIIGRFRGCDIRLEDDSVSRRHARIVRDRDGYFLEDLRSKAGTFVDGRRVHGPVRLRDGSKIQICDARFVFSAPVVTIRDEQEGSST